MKKKSLLILMAMSFFFLRKNVFGITYKTIKVGYSGVNLRSGPGTNYDVLTTVNSDEVFRLKEDKIFENEAGCTSGWYQIYYSGDKVGYVCKKYADETSITFEDEDKIKCENDLKELGFPDDYIEGLCYLKLKHPTWNFKPLVTNLDWTETVNAESACGKSYIQSTSESKIDPSCTNIYAESTGWHPASSKIVAYYLDPRNMFSDTNIFQYLYTKYDENFTDEKYLESVLNIIKSTHYYNYHLSLKNDLASIITNAGKENGVNPIFIAVRSTQELGSSDSEFNLYSGVYTGYENAYYGYYNFFNYGVYDSCKDITYCGLRLAKNRGWNSVQNAISGWANAMATEYINAGQSSIYLQKFNVAPTNPNNYFIHQYMTNISVASSESSTMYRALNNLELLEQSYEFYIPIYENMLKEEYIPNSGAEEIEEEEPNVTSIDISTIITSSGYIYKEGFISGINLGTKIEELKNNIASIAGTSSVEIYNQNNDLVEEGLIGTGYTVKVSNDQKSENLSVVIYGDTSGDGIINALDLLQIQKQILGTYQLENSFKLAADSSKDGTINALDLLQVQKQILNTFEINQKE